MCGFDGCMKNNLTERRINMHSIPWLLRKMVCCHIVLMAFSSFAVAALVPLWLDLYDGSDNHLMYMTFRYDAEGRNTGRTIYMPDETFMRDIAINYDDLGRRIKEVSYNFNGDTIYMTDYIQTESGTSFNIRDQFNLDLAGERVTYSNTDPLNFDLMYEETGENTASVKYTKDVTNGQLLRVDIIDRYTGNSYYGLFSYGEMIGVSHSGLKAGKLHQASIQSRASRIEVNFNLRSAGDVRCELMTLSGRRAAMLFSGRVQKGASSRHFNLDKNTGGISCGVYLLKVSVNGKGILHSKYLHQSSRAGGVR